MSLFNSRCILAVLLALGAAGLGYARWHEPPTPRASAFAAVPVGERVETNPEVTRPELGDDAVQDPWSPGTRLDYSVDFTHSVGQTGSSREPITLVGHATLTLTVASRQAAGVMLRGEISRLNLTLDSPAADAERAVEVTRQQLQQPFYFERTVDGHVNKLHTQADLFHLARGALRLIVGDLQFVVPHSKALDTDQWEAAEADASGTYTATYKRIGQLRFEKSKSNLKYLAADADALVTNNAKPAVHFQGTLQVTSELLLVEATTRERLDVPLGNVGISAQASVGLVLRGVSSGAVPPIDLQGLRAENLYDVRQADAPLDRELRQAKQLAAGTDTNSQLLELQSALARQDEEAASRAQERLTALVVTDRAASAQILNRLRRTTDAREGQQLLSALSNSESVHAQSALTQAVSDPSIGVEMRKSAVSHLALLNQPSKETMEFLANQAKVADDPQIRRRALFAAAATAHAGAANDTTAAVSGRIVDNLVENVKASRDLNELALNMNALSNTGANQVATLAGQYANSEDPMVRQLALQSVRRVSGADAEGILLNAIADQDPGVRAKALNILADRQYTDNLGQALLQSLGKATDADTRAGLVRVLGRVGGEQAGVLDALRALATRESNSQVQAALAEAIPSS